MCFTSTDSCFSDQVQEPDSDKVCVLTFSFTQRLAVSMHEQLGWGKIIASAKHSKENITSGFWCLCLHGWDCNISSPFHFEISLFSCSLPFSQNSITTALYLSMLISPGGFPPFFGGVHVHIHTKLRIPTWSLKKNIQIPQLICHREVFFLKIVWIFEQI